MIPLPASRSRARHRTRVIASMSAGAALIAGALVAAPANAAPPQTVDPTHPDFGPNVTIFSPDTPLDEIQSTLDALADAQRDAEMSSARHAVYFLPGDYGDAVTPLQFEVGYYTEVAGLGASPDDVTITGAIEVYNRCLGEGGTNCIALTNFWRTLGNLGLHISTPDRGCRTGTNFWAVSQAVSLRRLDVSGGNLSLMDYCTAGPQYASGGFIADSQLPTTINGSQQQWLTRNSEVANWTNGVWNQVFSGVVGAPERRDVPRPDLHDNREDSRLAARSRTSTSMTPGRYFVRVPSAQNESSGSLVERTARRRVAASRSRTSTSRSRAIPRRSSTPISRAASTCS